jgi:aspartyl-tRNA(Asn)/glutamyl-tRNA(Gln) amidotransferase subunit C
VSLTREEVEYVARLARLRLTDDELEHMRSQLSKILDSMSLLQEADVTGVEPTAQVGAVQTVMRPDLVDAGLDREQALSNAPDQHDGLFRVKAVFDE